MTQQASHSRLVAVLWFVAAVLAFVAFGIRMAADGERNWSVGVGGLFCLVMGIAALSRRTKPPG